MAFRYPATELESTVMMWNNIMDRIERDNQSSSTEVPITFKRKNLLRFAKKDFLRREQNSKGKPWNNVKGKPWNGRQIRNAFTTAIGLGRYQRLQKLSEKGISTEEAAASGEKELMEIQLTRTNFQDIAAAARSFEDYIEDLRGVDSENARLAKVRDDHWGSESPDAAKDYPNIRRNTIMEYEGPSWSSAAKAGLGMKAPDQWRTRPNQDTSAARVEGHPSEIGHSDDSDDSSSDDD